MGEIASSEVAWRFSRWQLFLARDEVRISVAWVLGTVAGLLTAFNLVTSADPWTRVMCAYLAASVVATVITGALSHAVFVQLDSGSLHELLPDGATTHPAGLPVQHR
ncbi:hypothetical protein ACF3NT_02365 [Naumannella halotolerans]|uniref:hypothetical protein n=1 Tax=Naumannella halotolerans TaxID=993414 RepID=UPI00370D7362